MQCQQESAFKALGGPAAGCVADIQVAVHCAPYTVCVYVYVYACVLDTCELISNDSVDYGLADYGLHGFENLSRTKHFFFA